MRLDNIGIDAADPHAVGEFWETALGATRLTTEPDLLESRLVIDGDDSLDICVVKVAEADQEPLRLHLDLLGGTRSTPGARRRRRRGCAASAPTTSTSVRARCPGPCWPTPAAPPSA